METILIQKINQLVPPMFLAMLGNGLNDLVHTMLQDHGDELIESMIEKLQSSRPLTHDLFSHTLKHFQIEIHEVCIEKLEEGIYYATIYFMKDGESVGIDSRTSDAIAMAMKFNAPIFVLQHIIDEAGYHDEEEEMDMDAPGRITNDELPPQQKVDHHNPYSDKTDEELESMLDEAISIEDYVKAARIRDEITKRK
jgi:bifunctional DNase/RNase